MTCVVSFRRLGPKSVYVLRNLLLCKGASLMNPLVLFVVRKQDIGLEYEIMEIVVLDLFYPSPEFTF